MVPHMENAPIHSTQDPKRQDPPRGRILIVDDEAFIRNAFRLYFETIGFQTLVAEGGESALAFFRDPATAIEVILLDLVMPGMHGLELLKVFKKERPDVEVIIATGCGSLSSAIEAMRHGAFDYITKPIVNFDEELLKVVEEALLHRRALQKNHPSPPPPNDSAVEQHGAAGEPGLEICKKFKPLACHLAFWRASPAAGEEARQEIENLEKLLKDEFCITSGLVFGRDEYEHFTPLHAWGHASPVDFKADWFSEQNLYHAVLDGQLIAFPTEKVDMQSLGFSPPSAVDHPVVLHLPLFLEGAHRGALFLFFSKNGCIIRHANLIEQTSFFQLIAPHLASFFLGITRKPALAGPVI
ncbi:MAG: response regulator [Planctomycetes bacterium]|nr:response regulator [Planctomycetota bacterium]